MEMDDAARAYIEAIDPEYRPLFDRVQRLVLDVHPDAEVGFSYQMPSYRVRHRRIHVGVWKHGVSLYGWGNGRDALAFAARHPELTSGKGTIRLRPIAAAAIPDDELRDLLRAALDEE
ncbi:MAG: DUF1801 domain-containing protein [Actinomycetota bacterium]|nr:DUF1801 domain-containing protein [Actinomycetota bacterium]